MMTGVGNDIQQFIIFGLLASALGIVGSLRLKGALSLWMLHALLLATLIITEAVKAKEIELFFVAGISLIVKACFIPWILNRAHKRSNSQWVGEIYLKRTSSLVVAGGLILLAYFITQPLEDVINPSALSELAIAFALVFLGFLLLIVRKVALIQVLGILILDNGLFLVGFSLTQGMPLLIEMGILLDVLAGAAILGVLAQYMFQSYDSLNVERLNSLKG